MKLPEDIKLDIQCFVYFLFKGTLEPRLIQLDYNYLDKLLDNPTLAYNCFEVFAFYAQQTEGEKPEKYVADYILEIHETSNTESTTIDLSEVKAFNAKTKSYWNDFLKLSKRFCHNNFPISVKAFNFKELNGVGTDAVPYFAVWTNVIEIDTAEVVTNSEHAFKRANERLKLWDGAEGIEAFSETELEQEIY